MPQTELLTAKRESHIHVRDYTIVPDDKSDAVAYLYEYHAGAGWRFENFPPANSEIRYVAAIFFGRQSKPVSHYNFKTKEKRQEEINRCFASRQASQAMKKKIKEDRDAAGRGMEVGDVLCSSWGYEQTNIDFYEVTKLVGKKSVEIRKIAQRSVETDYMRGETTPEPGVYVGEPMRRRAANGGVRIASYASAFKMDYTFDGEGNRVYRSRSWTSYH